jgi:copper oxidase (laccase) domain-containing protein
VDINLISPDWPAPAEVRACATTRQGGVSLGPYAGLNLARHVGDAAPAVAHNRALLAAQLGQMPVWLQQVHGVTRGGRRFHVAGDPGRCRGGAAAGGGSVRS